MSIIERLPVYYPTNFNGRIKGKKADVCLTSEVQILAKQRNALLLTLIYLSYDPPLSSDSIPSVLAPIIEEITKTSWNKITKSLETGEKV